MADKVQDQSEKLIRDKRLKEFEDIDRDHENIFANEQYVNIERKSSLFKSTVMPALVMTGPLTRMPTELMAATKDQLTNAGKEIKDKLYDLRQRRHESKPVQKILRDKVDDLIKDEQPLHQARCRDVVQCCRFKSLCHGRRQQKPENEESESDDDSNDFNDFNQRIDHYIDGDFTNKAWDDLDFDPEKLQERSLKMIQEKAQQIYNEKKKLAKSQLNYHELVTELIPTQDKILDLRAKQQNKKQDPSDNLKAQNGFLEYGKSIENFFNLELWLIKAFFWLTVLCIPQMIVFGANWQINDFQDSTFLSGISFAGFGQANNICSEGIVGDPTSLNEQFVNFTITCDPDYLVSEVFVFGHAQVQDGQDANKVCNYPTEAIGESTAYFNKTIVNSCQDKTGSCSTSVNVTGLQHQGDKWRDNTVFWIQAACTLKGGDTGEDMEQKRIAGLVVTVIGLFMCIYFRFTITRIQNDLDFEEQILDVDSVTVEDYTVKGKIPKDLFELILRQTEVYEQAQHEHMLLLDQDEKLSSMYVKPIKRFENYFKTVIQANLEHQEKKLHAKQHANKENTIKTGLDMKEKYRIVEISYAFTNRRMLQHLLNLNQELAKLGSIVPGCCWRIKYRKGLKQKVAQEFSDDEDLKAESPEDEKTSTCSNAWCRALCCGQRDAIDSKVEKFLAKFKLEERNIGKDQVKSILEQFFKQHNITIKLEDNLDHMMKKIDTDGDDEVSKEELKNYLELAIHNYKSNFAAMDDIEEKMFKLKEQKFVKLTNPKFFWITFMEGEAAKEMLQLKKIDFKRHPQPYLRINRKIEIEQAKSPSDILWPNVGYGIKRKLGIFVASGLFIIIVSAIAQMLFATEISAQMYIGYRANPPGVNCVALIEQMSDGQELETLAAIEYLRIQGEKAQDKGVRYLQERISKLGALPCFCENQADQGHPSDEIYTITLDEDADKTLTQPICEGQMKFSEAFGEGMLVYYGLSAAVVAQSFAFRFMFMQLAKTLKISSESKYLSLCIVAIFGIYFINYGIAFLMGPIKANIPGLKKISLNFGVYYDFNEAWFNDIGQLIVVNAIIYAFMPFVEDWLLVWLPNYISQSIDETDPKLCCCFCFRICCKCCKKKKNNSDSTDDQDQQSMKDKLTRTTSLFEYKDLFSGPVFDFHYKHAYMLTLVWVTFLFAPGMPILFPIALLAMIILYMSNQMMLAKVCKRPPAYDESMTKVTLKLLKVAPLLYALMGAWLYSNQQTFYNKVNPIKDVNDIMMPTDHDFSLFLTQITPGSVFFIYILSTPTFLFTKWLLRQCSKHCCCKCSKRNKSETEPEVAQTKNCCKTISFKCNERLSDANNSTPLDQDLPSFYRALTLHDRLSLIADEIENYKRLQIKRLSLENFLYLIFMPQVKSKGGGKSKRLMQGTSSYRILRQAFAEKFHYISQPGFGLKQTDFVVTPYGNEKEVFEQDKQIEEEDDELLKTTDSFAQYQKIKKEENKYLLEMKKCQLDVVRAAAELAYISPELALRIHFSPGYIHLNNKAKLNFISPPDRESQNDRITIGKSQGDRVPEDQEDKESFHYEQNEQFNTGIQQ